MPGLDRKIIDLIDPDTTLARIRTDIRTDFILAPHHNAIFINTGAQVWDKVSELLRSGNYQPSLPLMISVPKERGFARPGNILEPFDRFVYQALLDLTAPVLEAELDRERVFSYELVDEKNQMFEASDICWENFQHKIAEICDTPGYMVKADVANYFERIPQHYLINLMNAAECPGEIVNLLEEMLLAFQERDSFGIVQGVFPSDILGNFFLCDLDGYCELYNIPSARYVDDCYLWYPSEFDARKGLISLVERLRKNGLHLNEFKSGIHTTDAVMREETEIDNLFGETRNAVREELSDGNGGYGFAADWELEDTFEEEDEEAIYLKAVSRLYSYVDDFPDQSDKIEKYCLPLLRTAGSDIAVKRTLKALFTKPHMTRLYHAYLSRFVPNDKKLTRRLEALMEKAQMVCDYQRMYFLGSLMNASVIQSPTVNTALHWLESSNIGQETRALAAIFVARHGSPVQKRAVKVAYETEQSIYVRSAILYSARHFTATEKRVCRKAWGGHNLVNALVAQAIAR